MLLNFREFSDIMRCGTIRPNHLNNVMIMYQNYVKSNPIDKWQFDYQLSTKDHIKKYPRSWFD